MVDLLELKKELYDVLGCFYEVHDIMGPGLNEYCYHDSLEIELSDKHIPYQREVNFVPSYKGKKLKSPFRMDFLCKDKIIVECKAINELTTFNRAQLFNYMRLTKEPCGVLVNFYNPKIAVERYFYDKETNQILNVHGSVIFCYKPK